MLEKFFVLVFLIVVDIIVLNFFFCFLKYIKVEKKRDSGIEVKVNLCLNFYEVFCYCRFYWYFYLKFSGFSLKFM